MNEYMQKPLRHGSESDAACRIRQRLSYKESWRAAGSTERLYEDEIYKYLAISSLLCFGTQ